jgi:hypothetical protein
MALLLYEGMDVGGRSDLKVFRGECARDRYSSDNTMPHVGIQ